MIFAVRKSIHFPADSADRRCGGVWAPGLIKRARPAAFSPSSRISMMPIDDTEECAPRGGGRMPRGPPGMDQACAAGMGQAWASGDGSGVGLGQWIRRLAHGDTGMPRGSTSTLACVEAWVKTAVQPMCHGRPRVRRNPRASRIISRRGRNENEGVVDCESLRLRVSARVGLSFHTFSRPCRKRSAT